MKTMKTVVAGLMVLVAVSQSEAHHLRGHNSQHMVEIHELNLVDESIAIGGLVRRGLGERADVNKLQNEMPTESGLKLLAMSDTGNDREILLVDESMDVQEKVKANITRDTKGKLLSVNVSASEMTRAYRAEGRADGQRLNHEALDCKAGSDDGKASLRCVTGFYKHSR